MRYLEILLGTVAGIAALATAGLAVFIATQLGIAIASAPSPVQITDTPQISQPENAVVVEVTAVTNTPTPDQPAPATEPEVTLAATEISAKGGEKVFKKCKACHTIDEGGKNRTGPNLWGIINKPVASAEGFKFSDAMRAMSDRVWDVELLDTYLTKPKEVVPGTKMTFAGLSKEEDRQALMLYLAQNSSDMVAAAAPADDASAEAVETAEEEVVAIDPVLYPEGVTYSNPAARTEEETTRIAGLVTALEALAPTLDYERARFHPLHFPPAITGASNEECLVCHQEIMTDKPLEVSPAGVPASETIAWYQTLDTYSGDQESFHYRHLQSEYAQEVMNLECTFCHKGNDPREESPDMMTGRPALSASASPEFTLRKMVNPSETCLRCHGAMPDPEVIMGVFDPWPVARLDMEYPEAPNGCLSCHAESFRTERHNVSYLNAANIEELARAESSDSCYGCHGGRSWYRVSYPYPRHAWPDMYEDEVSDWAIGRATESDPEYALPSASEE